MQGEEDLRGLAKIMAFIRAVRADRSLERQQNTF